MSDTIRCRTRPYYYMRRLLESWRLSAALTVVGVGVTLLGALPIAALVLLFLGSVNTAWVYLDDKAVVYEGGGAS